MNVVMYDAIVIGAGPSGSYCSYLLAANGFSTLIIEKNQFPRKKLCGGGVSYKTVNILKLINYIYSDLIHGKISPRRCCFYSIASLPLSVVSGNLDEHNLNEVGLLS